MLSLLLNFRIGTDACNRHHHILKNITQEQNFDYLNIFELVSHAGK